tara:strand:- start:356 stop:1558 length:1203 start_codon:yes stop_codon:yes gene_type:complete
MKFIFKIFVLVSIAIGVAIFANLNKGNVVILFPPYRIDLSLNFLIFLFFIIAIFFIFITSVAKFTFEIPKNLINFRKKRKNVDQFKMLKNIFQSFLEGDFSNVEKLLKDKNKIDLNDYSSVINIIAAKAANNLKKYDLRNNFLKRAKDDPNIFIAASMAEIEMKAKNHHETDDALKIIDELKKNNFKNMSFYELSIEVNINAKNWEEVLNLISIIEKDKSLDHNYLKKIKTKCFESLLSDKNKDIDYVKTIWKRISKKDTYDPKILVPFVNALINNDDKIFANKIVENALNYNWNQSLLSTYLKCSGIEGSDLLISQIKKCESWIKERPNDDYLLLITGHFCLIQKLWGKSQSYLEKCLSFSNDPMILREANILLAILNDILGKNEIAYNHFKVSSEYLY